MPSTNFARALFRSPLASYDAVDPMGWVAGGQEVGFPTISQT
jgi:hypothetical protein